MRVQRFAARQAHPIPLTAYSARGPFPQELFASSPVITDYQPQPDGGGEVIEEGATAQNNFQPTRWYRCTFCDDLVSEHHLEEHVCPEEL
jgi:hypothetical protein